MDFDFNQIKINIRRGFYRYIGSGSGRKVFDLGNGYVVKAARNYKGIAQNKVEYQIGTTEDSKILAKVLAVSNDFKMLIMVKAERIRSIYPVLNYFNVRKSRDLFYHEEINGVLSRHHLLFGDLCRTGSWGIVDGQPVIIDFGFTREVRRKFYFFSFF